MKTCETFTIAGHQIRGYEEAGILWFVGHDLAKALGVKPDHAFWNLDGTHQGLILMATKGGPQTVKTISLEGFIGMILRSRKQEGKELLRWLTGLMVPYLALRVKESIGHSGVSFG